MAEDFAESHKLIGVATYSFAAILGVVAANYYEQALPGMYSEIIGGVIGLLIPCFLIKDNGGYMGPVRMFFGVAGLSLLIRGINSVLGSPLGTSTTAPNWQPLNG
jgi:hypothetical protein